MTTYPLPTLAASISSTGISAPSFDDTYLSLCASYRAIYGADVNLDADTQDGQWIATIAQAVTDVNGAAIAVYNSFSPVTAQGVGLSSVVKINGLEREATSQSSCPVLITGAAGTTITNGVVQDDAGYAWSLPASVVIPPSSSIIVTATCQTAGAIQAGIGTITSIRTPTRGWLTVTNPEAAAIGAAGESDAKLKARQSVSTALPARTPMESVAARVQNLPGVVRINYSENSTGMTNADGVPAHSFGLVVEGGDASAIAQTIANSKLGAGTYGSITTTVIDGRGIPSSISFSTPTYKRIVVNISLKPLTGYTIGVGDALVAAVAAYITGLPIGKEIDLNNVIAEAIDGSGARTTFKIPPGGITMTVYGGTASAADIVVAYDEAATCSIADISLSLVP